MSSVLNRGSPTGPLLGFTAAAAVEAVRLFLHASSGPRDAVLEILALVAFVVAGGLALRSATVAREALGAVQDEAADLKRVADGQAEVIDGAGEAIVVIDDQASIVTFNRAAERMFGYSAAEMIGTSLERLMTEGARKAHAAYLANTGVTAMVEAARLRTVHKGVRKKGDVFTFELMMTEWADDGRRMFTGVLRDVTKREHTADDLRKANGRYSELFDAMGDPLIIFTVGGDGEFALETMNTAAETFTGFSRFVATGWTPDQLGKTEGRAFKRALLECLSSAGPVAAEVPLMVKDRARTASLALSPLRSGAGEVHSVLVRIKALQPAAGRAKAPAAG
ncbi:MAG: PAS domain S-box protein [Phenylobacterium sp.]|nr:MAG: PAS domain S-box protein [Phenylobacterium sp.]